MAAVAQKKGSLLSLRRVMVMDDDGMRLGSRHGWVWLFPSLVHRLVSIAVSLIVSSLSSRHHYLSAAPLTSSARNVVSLLPSSPAPLLPRLTTVQMASFDESFKMLAVKALGSEGQGFMDFLLKQGVTDAEGFALAGGLGRAGCGETDRSLQGDGCQV